MTGPGIGPAGGFDLGLHLLDRQVVDVDGRLVAKVDDVELTRTPGPDGSGETAGAWVPTGLLVGAAALLPRLGRGVGPPLARLHRRLGVSEEARSRPAVIDLGLVRGVDSAVRLGVRRGDLLLARSDPPPGGEVTRLRAGALLGARVLAAPGVLPDSLGRRPRVLDVRLAQAPAGGAEPSPPVVALLIGRGRPGGLVGYDRPGVDGPRMLAHLVRRRHRGARLLPIAEALIELAGSDVVVRASGSGRPVGPQADQPAG